MKKLNSDNNTEELEKQNAHLKHKVLTTEMRLFIEDLPSSSPEKIVTSILAVLNNHGIDGLQYLLERTCESGKSGLFSSILSDIRATPKLNEKWERIESKLKEQSTLSEALALRLTKRKLEYMLDTNNAPEPGGSL